MQNPSIDQRMASPVQITKNKATSSQSVSVGKAGPRNFMQRRNRNSRQIDNTQQIYMAYEEIHKAIVPPSRPVYEKLIGSIGITHVERPEVSYNRKRRNRYGA